MSLSYTNYWLLNLIEICNVISLNPRMIRDSYSFYVFFYIQGLTSFIANKMLSMKCIEFKNSLKVLEIKVYLIPVIFTRIPNYSLEDVAVIAKNKRFIGLMEHGLEGERGSWTFRLLSLARMRQVLTTGAAFWDNWQLLLYFFILFKERIINRFQFKSWGTVFEIVNSFLFFNLKRNNQPWHCHTLKVYRKYPICYYIPSCETLSSTKRQNINI